MCLSWLLHQSPCFTSLVTRYSPRGQQAGYSSRRLNIWQWPRAPPQAQANPPGHNALPLPPDRQLEAAGCGVAQDLGVVDEAEVHAHEPEADSGIFYGCELELHRLVHVQQGVHDIC